jgi:hypothetical protein
MELRPFIMSAWILSLAAGAVPDPDQRPGTWVTYHQEDSSMEASRSSCGELADELSSSDAPYRFMGQHFAQLRQSFFCNLDVVEYLPKAREYLRELPVGDDFDFSRAADLEYAKIYFQKPLAEVIERYSPFPVEFFRHGLYSDNRKAFFRYEVTFPLEFVPHSIEEKIFVDQTLDEFSRTEEDALVKRDFLESLLVRAYAGHSLEITERGVDRNLQSTPDGFETYYRGWLEYRVRFPIIPSRN